MLVDIHAHLDHDRFKKDLDKVIERARKKDVKYIITSGVNKSTNRKALELSKKYQDIVKASLGIYPLDALEIEMKEGDFPRVIEKLNVDEEIEFIRKNKNKIIAIGEAGLDYNYTKDKNKEQKEVFQKVISLAEKIKKPLIVHSRKAEIDVIEMLRSSTLKKVIMHCFTAKLKLAKKAEDLGYYFSIPPIIVRLRHFQELVDRLSLDKILTETDCPYLSPIAGERNEPSFIVETIKKIAEIKKLTEKEIKNIIFMNFQKVFLK